MDYNDSILCDIVSSDNNIESLQRLLAMEKNPNLTDSSGDTLLHIAAKSSNDNPGIVQELITAGADVCRLDSTSSTALHYAVIGGKRKVVDVLLQTGIPINQKDYLGITALHYATNRNLNRIYDVFGIISDLFGSADMYIIRKLLNHTLIDVNETDRYQQTPLVWAIQIKDFEIVKLLLNKNARVDTSDTFGHTPLYHAVFRRNHHIVVALLLKRANLLKIAGDGQTPWNNIINSEYVEFACKCLKVIAFNYNFEVLLTNKKIKNSQLQQFLDNCWDEIEDMKNDIIVNELTVFDFFSKCAAKPGFDNPILQIYKPMVEKLLAGIYPIYLFYILNRMSKSTLHAVLEVYINEKYHNKSCTMEHFKAFSIIIQSRLLFKHLSNQGIFYLILALTDKKGSEYLLDFNETEWRLTDLWDVYPNDHFC